MEEKIEVYRTLEQRNPKEAGKLYEERGLIDDACRVYQESGQTELIIEKIKLLIKNKRYDETRILIQETKKQVDKELKRNEDSLASSQRGNTHGWGSALCSYYSIEFNEECSKELINLERILKNHL